MSPYTPTTEEVRLGCRVVGDWFDLWLAEVKEQAWDEGFREGLDGDRGDPNPYRQES